MSRQLIRFLIYYLLCWRFQQRHHQVYDLTHHEPIFLEVLEALGHPMQAHLWWLLAPLIRSVIQSSADGKLFTPKNSMQNKPEFSGNLIEPLFNSFHCLSSSFFMLHTISIIHRLNHMEISCMFLEFGIQNCHLCFQRIILLNCIYFTFIKVF